MKKKWLILATAVVAAFVIRLLLLKYAYPSWWHGMTMEGEAANILDGFGYVSDVKLPSGEVRKIPFVHDVPAYAYFVAAVWKVVGARQYIYPQLVQIGLDSLFVLVLFAAARRFIGETEALVTACLYALYLPVAYLAINSGRDMFGTFGLMGGTLFFFRGLERQKPLWFLWSALVIGLTCYFRPTYLFIPPFFAAALWAWRTKWPKILATVGAMIGTVYLILLPWALRNHHHYNKWIFTRYGMNQALWGGMGQFPNPFGAIYHDGETLEEMKRRGFRGYSNSVPEYEDFMRIQVRQALKEHPWWYVGSVFRRIPMAVFVNRIPWGVLQGETRFSYHRMYANDNDRKNIWDFVKKMAVLNRGLLFTKLLDALVLGLALTGVILRRRSWRQDTLLWSVPLYLIAVHAPIAVEGRYMVPGHWVYLIFASVALVSAFRSLRTKAG